MALITQTEVEQRLGRTLTADEASSFTLINAALQSVIEEMIASDLAEVVASTRYYDGGVQHLAIDPCTSITAVKYVDEYENVIDTIDAYNYTLEPRNATLKTMVRHRGRFATGSNNVTVTAKFSVYDDTKTLKIIKEGILIYFMKKGRSW